MKRRKSITGRKPKRVIRKTSAKPSQKQHKSNREEAFSLLDKIKKQLPVYLALMADLVYDLLSAKCNEATMTSEQLLAHIGKIGTEEGDKIRKEINRIENEMKVMVESSDPLINELRWTSICGTLNSIYTTMTSENTRQRVTGYVDK